MITRLVYGWMALWVADLATAQLPISPCPGIFHYEYYASQWTGLVTINTPYQTNVIYLRVKMSIAARLSTTYGGKLDLVDNQAASLQQALQGGVIHYRVYFPLTSPLPVLTDLTLNGNLLCQGPPEQASYVTTISLDHKLFTTESFQPSITYNQPHNQYYGPGADTYGQQGSGYQIAAQVTAKPEPAYQPIAYPDIINYSGDNINQPIVYPVIPTSTTSGTTLRRPTKKVWKCGVLGQVRLVPLIVGGETTAPGDWPWLAVILIDDVKSLKFICGGTIVSNKHIVTAAHCVHTEKGKLVTIGDVFVRVGAYNLHEWTDESRPQGVAHISLTSDFSQENNLKDDIAILVLKKFLTFSQNVTPVCLWREDSDLSRVVGVKSTVVGWGRDENGLSATPEPRRAFLSVVSSETCRSSRVEFEAYVTDKVFCAGDRNGSGPCKGDSGGGLYIYRNNRWRLRGVVSFSLQDPTSSNICNVYEYIIFTDAAKYVPWIDKIIKTNQ